MKKNIVAFISFIILIFICLILIICFRQNEVEKKDDKFQIIATLFPQYDLAKHIVEEKMDVRLLLDSGIETHNYEPTPKDMIVINNSDIFLYTGNKLEPWTTTIIQTIDQKCKVADISEGIDLIKIEDFEKRHINKIENNHNHKQGNNHEHEEIYDGHIWLNPQNTVKMLENILEVVCKIDSKNSHYYKQNAEKYKNEILNLDQKLSDIISKSAKKEIAVGGEFAYAYLVERYNIDFVSVYNNCGDGEDPSISKVKSVIDYMNKNDMNIVFYEELTEGTVAKMIAEETDAESLILYSIHNADISKDTYISLFEKNIINLEKALK